MDINRLRAEAEAGSVVSQGVQGLFYLFGDEVPQHYVQALFWLARAPEQGAARPAV